MTLFAYKAVRHNGETLKGEMEAADEMALARSLQEQGAMPVEVAPVNRSLSLSFLRAGKREKLDAKQVTLITRELSTLLSAGLTLDRSLQILTELSDNEQMNSILIGLKESVQGGATFSKSLEAAGPHFSKLYINMIKAGESGGALQAVLGRLADYLESTEDLKESVKSALVYPVILLVVAGLSVVLLLMFVVPQFSQMFDDMGQELPLATQIVIGLGDLFRAYWWVMLGGILLVTAFVKAQLEKPKIRYRWDRRVLGMPLFGDLVAKIETARFSRTLATLLDNGLPLLSALNLVKDVVSNQIIAEGIQHSADHLKRGKGLADPLAESKVFPPLALQMVKVGEESGSLEEMLGKIADVYDQEVRVTVKRMLTLLEPAMIVGLGLMVAGIIISILLAILKANQLVF